MSKSIYNKIINNVTLIQKKYIFKKNIKNVKKIYI